MSTNEPLAAIEAQYRSREDIERYHELEGLVAARLKGMTGEPVFTTNAGGPHYKLRPGMPEAADLYDRFLNAIPEDRRQHYNCKSCRRFVNTYGGLVSIDERGVTDSVVWGVWAKAGIPPFFAEAVWAVQREVLKAKVTGLFVSAEETWGTPANVGNLWAPYSPAVPGVPRPPFMKPIRTVTWTHLHGRPAKVFTHPVLSAEQYMAEKLQDYIMLKNGLKEYPMAAVAEAVRVLEAGNALDRSEKTLGIAKWLLELHRSLEMTPKGRWDNLVWRAVASAPPGFCHVRSTMIATLLDDILQGLPYETVARRWAAKMHPLQYQRPTKISDGAIEQAEKLVEKLGIRESLPRRFAKLSDVEVTGAGSFLWRPVSLSQNESTTGNKLNQPNKGVFDRLKSKSKAAEVKKLELPAVTVSWEKFARDVLPKAVSMEVKINSGRLPLYGLVTAVNLDAPPILQWDGLKQLVKNDVDDPGAEVEPLSRNPISWYFYHGGSSALQWGLLEDGGPDWVEVAAVLPSPAHFQRPDLFGHYGRMVLFVLKGCIDQMKNVCGSFFPEFLRSELHGVRQVMEAHAKATPLAGREEADANGIALQFETNRAGDQTNNWQPHLRVKTEDGNTLEYLVDRLD